MQSSSRLGNTAFVEEAIPFIIYDSEQRSNLILVLLITHYLEFVLTQESIEILK